MATLSVTLLLSVVSCGLDYSVANSLEFLAILDEGRLLAGGLLVLAVKGFVVGFVLLDTLLLLLLGNELGVGLAVV